jgi:hypothetical protein
MRSILRSCLVLGLGLATLPALASFEISSSISDSISESVGSVSASIRTSSESVSGDTKTAQGPYEVMDVQPVAERPGSVRLALRALQEGAQDIELTLPQQALERGRIVVGSVIEAQPREFGIAFAARDATGQTQAFFLVVHDERYREFATQRVTL